MLKQMIRAAWKRHRGVSITLRMEMHIAQIGAVIKIDQNSIYEERKENPQRHRFIFNVEMLVFGLHDILFRVHFFYPIFRLQFKLNLSNDCDFRYA